MFLRTIYFFVLMLVGMSMAAAQNACNDLYTKAKASHQKGDYADAFAKYRAVKLCNPALSSEVDKRVEQLFADVNNERQKAEKARNEAIAAQQKTAEALQLAENERLKNKRIVDATYFHADKFGLGYRKTRSLGKYGYIDKEGRVVIDFQFEKATPFADDGFARVEKNDIKYLLDTLGQFHELAESIAEITPTTEAIDLKGRNLKVFPPKILNAPNLRILLIADSKLSILPDSIYLLDQLEYLDISGNELTALPNSITKLPLIHLNLNTNKLSKLPDSIGDLSKLVWLELDENELTLLPTSFVNLRELAHLNLDNNHLTSLPSGFEHLSKLKNLILSRNEFGDSEWVRVVAQMPLLEQLDISATALKSLPSDFFKTISKSLKLLYLTDNPLRKLPQMHLMPALGDLDLSRTAIAELSVDFSLMPALESLDMSHLEQLKKMVWSGRNEIEILNLDEYPLTELPSMVGGLPNLRTLYLGNSKIKSLPKWIATAHLLEQLYLNDCVGLEQLEGLDKLVSLQELDMEYTTPEIVNAGLLMIAKIPNLKILNLNNSDLDTLPECICGLIHVQKLGLYNNNLNTLPQCLSLLKNLKEIELVNNQFTVFPDILYQMHNLEYIGIARNMVSVIPDKFSQASQLKRLELNENKLKMLPQSLQNLSKLNYFDASNNQLQAFPNAIVNCQLIEKLYLSNNQISEIPSTISQLIHLKSLDISKNMQLEDLPATISELVELKDFTLSNCAISPLRITQLKKALPRCDFD